MIHIDPRRLDACGEWLEDQFRPRPGPDYSSRYVPPARSEPETGIVLLVIVLCAGLIALLLVTGLAPLWEALQR